MLNADGSLRKDLFIEDGLPWTAKVMTSGAIRFANTRWNRRLRNSQIKLRQSCLKIFFITSNRVTKPGSDLINALKTTHVRKSRPPIEDFSGSVAIPTSLIFLIQTIMTFAGVDATDGLEADFDGELAHGETPFQLFSLRNLINFLLGFSWTGVSFFNTIENKPLLIGLAVLVGSLLFTFFFFWSSGRFKTGWRTTRFKRPVPSIKLPKYTSPYLSANPVREK